MGVRVTGIMVLLNNINVEKKPRMITKVAGFENRLDIELYKGGVKK